MTDDGSARSLVYSYKEMVTVIGFANYINYLLYFPSKKISYEKFSKAIILNILIKIITIERIFHS